MLESAAAAANSFGNYSGPSLDAFFRPRSVAVIGATATARKVGRILMTNLQDGKFDGGIFPVNPKYERLFGLPCYPSIGAIPHAVDLAVIAVPAEQVPAVVEQSGAAGVRAALVISAGFKEAGSHGKELENRLVEVARRRQVRVLGPNCLGLISPFARLNATFAGVTPLPGNVAFLSQSGALCTAVLDWSLRERIGFSAFVSLGSMADIAWGDLIDYFGDDSRTSCIVLYMETVGDPRTFLSAAREAARKKPIIVLKAGRSREAAKAAVSHTGALAGSDEVLDAAFRRCGVLRVGTVADLFYMSEVLSRQSRPEGPRLTIVTNAGGPGVLATDSLIANGGELAPLSASTIAKLDVLLPDYWSRSNPVDVLGDAGPERYAEAVRAALKDPKSDGVLVILSPQAMTDPAKVAEKIAPLAHSGRPLLASWMGGSSVALGEYILNRAGVPTFPYPDSAARAFEYMWQYSRNLQSLYETPVIVPDAGGGDARARDLIDSVRRQGRTLMTEIEAKEVLAAFGIPVTPTRLARTEDEAADIAGELGFPVAVKLNSTTITHKARVNGVRLNLPDAAWVRLAFREIRDALAARGQEHEFEGVSIQPMRQGDYELILGSTVDSQFGPTLLFGAGGRLVEVLEDRSIALPPLNTTLARRMIEQTRISRALKGERGHCPVDQDALESLIVRFSRMIAEHPCIKEVDINPLLASARGFEALDARIVLYGKETPGSDLPQLAIRPYPRQYEACVTLHSGQPVTIRPIRPEDEPLMAGFHEGLSERSVYRRYFSLMTLAQRTAHERLARVCSVDYDREIALVAEHHDPNSGMKQIVAVARLVKSGGVDAEFALVVSDHLQRQGLGLLMMERMIATAAAEGIRLLHSWILPENLEMKKLCVRAGFAVKFIPGEGLLRASKTLVK